MDYKKIYDKIIENTKINPICKAEYGENHHIIPRSLGGSDDSENLVRLTAREHFISHALLAEMYERETFEWYKMNHAFMMMKTSMTTHIRYFNSRLYELKRKDFAITNKWNQTGEKNSQYGKIWMYSDILEKNIKVPKNKINQYKLSGWSVGRKMSWDVDIKNTKCKCCGKYFTNMGNYKLCSTECKSKYIKELREPKSIKKNIKLISNKHIIKFGRIAENKEFIIECLSNRCSKNQICEFLKVNNSGANYKAISNLLP
jgi:hypothetical protein